MIPDLAAYHRWLYKTAAGYLPDGFTDPDLDDLVQEGRIAMWKAYDAYDDCKGTLAPWLTNAARLRMRGIALGHDRYTGHAGRKGWTDAYPRRGNGNPRPYALSTLMEDPEFDERRLRPPVAKSVKHRYP